MEKFINLGNEKSAIETLTLLKENKYENLEIRIYNSHITDLNKTLGKKVFKNNAVYANAIMFWEVMQPVGGKGKHHYHNLSPENLYEALSTLRYSEKVTLSYDNRYVIVTLATIAGGINIAAIVTPEGHAKQLLKRKVVRIITIYPCDK